MNALTHTEFRRICSTLAFADIKKAADWIVSLAKVQILFIDDLGKGRSTPASEEGFFDLLDARYKSNLPTLYTSNMEPAQIEAGFTEGYGPGLIRRVLDTTKQIEF
jgi:DNA replication protein DnaC